MRKNIRTIIVINELFFQGGQDIQGKNSFGGNKEHDAYHIGKRQIQQIVSSYYFSSLPKTEWEQLLHVDKRIVLFFISCREQANKVLVNNPLTHWKYHVAQNFCGF